MQELRKTALAVGLGAAITLSAAATSTPATAHRHGSLDDSLITQILDFFGIELQNRFSIPPG
ncbi:MAG TPA: hypothetical protein VF432_01720 [Thermoanaerobaculia bacterium]